MHTIEIGRDRHYVTQQFNYLDVIIELSKSLFLSKATRYLIRPKPFRLKCQAFYFHECAGEVPILHQQRAFANPNAKRTRQISIVTVFFLRFLELLKIENI